MKKLAFVVAFVCLFCSICYLVGMRLYFVEENTQAIYVSYENEDIEVIDKSFLYDKNKGKIVTMQNSLSLNWEYCNDEQKAFQVSFTGKVEDLKVLYRHFGNVDNDCIKEYISKDLMHYVNEKIVEGLPLNECYTYGIRQIQEKYPDFGLQVWSVMFRS